ncbi:hypothetical protein NDR87_01210 [Nocardia sp. CDC159]|uniref:Uncharacterized protein n=1 Tax=Nocardia pulmonis TaxID=2951408 RepID=A0A9X2E2E2_9NOCA|nr:MULTISPECIES: hypothetical protein [Nocardia]MCM6772371.1 hypothetical protein [Nocardia pulmonis]MCM6784971.1 hypothetical protein [Nocardia sp. CDC159]
MSGAVTNRAADIVAGWPQPSRAAALAVLDAYGEPHEATDSALIWHGVGPWRRLVASRSYWEHNFPAPHTDSVSGVVEYPVPVAMYSTLARFDGGLTVDRTTGEVSSLCHDERSNLLALNLMHDIVSGARSPEQARDYYTKEFLDHRRGKPTPYMEGLRFEPRSAPDPDERLISEADLAAAVAERGDRPER